MEKLKHSTEALKRRFESLGFFFLKKRITVNILDNTDDAGWTVPGAKGRPGQINLSYTCRAYDSVPGGAEITPEYRELLILGVYTHEILHQMFTPFEYEKSIKESIAGDSCKRIFHTLFNIVEDPRIERASSMVFGGTMLTALNASISHFYNFSKNLEDLQPSGDEYIISQIFNALVMLGDRGPVKGHFTNTRAAELFEEIRPLFYRAVNSDDGKTAVDISKDIFDILYPLIQAQEQNEDNISKRTGDSDGDGNGENLPENTPGEKSLFGENSGAAPEYGSAVSSDKCKEGKSGKYVSSADAEDIGKAIESMGRELSDIEEGMEEERKREEETALRQKDDVEPDSKGLRHTRMTGADEAAYNEIVLAESKGIESLYRQIKQIFRGDTGGKQYSANGRLSLKRISDGYLHSELMENRRAPRDLSDCCIEFLVDESGSMNMSCKADSENRRCDYAKNLAIILYEVFSRFGIPIKITGFTTVNDYCNTPLSRNYIIWHSTRKDRLSLCNICGNNDNIDGVNIREAARDLAKRREKHKLLIVISDGQPCPGIFAEKAIPRDDVKDAVDRAVETGISVIGVAIEPRSISDYSYMYGQNFVAISEMKEFYSSFAKKLKCLLRDWP